MSLHRVVGIAGNLKRPSRTRALVEAVAAPLARRRDVDLLVYDLLDAGPGLGAAYARGDLTPEAARVAGMPLTACVSMMLRRGLARRPIARRRRRATSPSKRSNSPCSCHLRNHPYTVRQCGPPSGSARHGPPMRRC